MTTERTPPPSIDERDLRAALSSPLRLRLVAELLEQGRDGLSLEQCVLRTGRHGQDVEACLRPMLTAWNLVERTPEETFRIADGIGAAPLAVLKRAVERGADQLERERRIHTQVLGGMIGVDPKMSMVFEMIMQVARLDVPVLITGETGTGKELVARAIHELGARRTGTLGAINCATLSEELFASEMFGHAKGAFTGAIRVHIGWAERCDGGTLFLDEIGDLSLANQVKLLRLLQEGAFTRVGEGTSKQSDFRVIAATHRDLSAMVEEGAFREDLYYRLNVLPLRVPSLRERISDIPYLVDALLRGRLRRVQPGDTAPSITQAALQRLAEHRWPGNVRELENVLARALVSADTGLIDVAHLSHLTPTPVGRSGAQLAVVHRTLADVEKEHIARVMEAEEGVISRAAQVLGISRTTLYKKLHDHGLA